MSKNPLQKFFRQPAIYFPLPSKGQNYAPGVLDLPANGEVPIYPMTAMDEITYRTPDALFNGEAVVSVIQSCVPNISNAWLMPSTDFDAVLVAIRVASYGHAMDMDTTCPKCETEQDFALDLRKILDSFQSVDYSEPVVIGDLTLHFRPLNYQEMTQNSQLQFEQQKTMQAVTQVDLPEEEKLARINDMMRRMVDATMQAIGRSIIEVRTTDAIVTEQSHIQEFLVNCDRKVFNQIKDRVLALKEKSELKPLPMTCQNCSHKYEQLFTLDQANFFASDS